jgi:hypothetical protein
MTSERPKSLIDLIGNVCDERSDREDLRQLNRLLKADPIAQEEYLDQMLIDGLLQREFAGLKPTEPQIASDGDETDGERGKALGRAKLFIAIPAALAVLIFVGATGWLWPRSEPPFDVSVELANASFEEVASISYHPTNLGWYGDKAHAVREVSGVSPHHGEFMLQLVQSTSEPEDSCEVYQIVDLSHLAGLARKNPMFVEATALVNSLVGDHSDSYVFSIQIYASPVNPLDQQSPLPTNWKSTISYVGNQIAADLDHRSWQQISSVMPLSADAPFLLIQISVRRNDQKHSEVYPGHFVDNVTLKLKKARTLKDNFES